MCWNRCEIAKVNFDKAVLNDGELDEAEAEAEAAVSVVEEEASGAGSNSIVVTAKGAKEN